MSTDILIAEFNDHPDRAFADIQELLKPEAP